jgi:hypothetical protein
MRHIGQTSLHILINVYWNKYGLIQTDATNDIVVYSFLAWLITESITMHSVHLPFQSIKILHLGQGNFTRKVRTIFTLKLIVSIFVKLFLILVLHLRQFFIIRIFVKRTIGWVLYKPESSKLWIYKPESCVSQTLNI